MPSERIREIELDRSSGATKIAQKALQVLRFFAQKSENKNSEEFKKVGKKLSDSRSNMAPVKNLVSQIVYEVNNLDEDNLADFRKFVVLRIDELVKKSEIAVNKSANLASIVIIDSKNIATCSYSWTVCEAFRIAKEKGKRFKVFVAESKTEDNNFCYGQTLAAFLRSIDILVKVFPDNEIHNFIPKVKCVLVGADSVMCDGSIINGTPTFELAVQAKNLGLPFYSVCETAKIDCWSYLGKKVKLKKGFDFIPANLITEILTEAGILDSNKIAGISKEKLKFHKNFQSK